MSQQATSFILMILLFAAGWAYTSLDASPLSLLAITILIIIVAHASS